MSTAATFVGQTELSEEPESESTSVILARRVRLLTLAAIAAHNRDEEAGARLSALLEGPGNDALDRGFAPLRRIAMLFRLTPADCDVLLVCIAHAVDPSLGSLFAEIDGGCGCAYVTEPLVVRLFGHVPGLVWNPAGPLASWKLVQAHAGSHGQPPSLMVDAVVPAWLNGEFWVDRDLNGIISSATSVFTIPSWPVDTLRSTVRQALEQGRPVQCLLSGEVGTGRTALGAAVAARLGLAALVVDTGQIADADWSDVYVRLQRLAAVAGAALIWRGSHVDRDWPATVAPAPIHFLAVAPGEGPRAPWGMSVLRTEVTEPTIEERRELWRTLIPVASAWPAAELDALAARYRLGAGDIAVIAAGAVPTPAAAAVAARTCRSLAREDIVQSIDCPYEWDDLVLPDPLKAALADFAFEVGERERVWQEAAAGRLMPREPALAALFCGPSGCGKTMAAQVIAAQLGLELLRVDIASVLSRYIGDTARNLSRVFALARRRQAILLFDEADSHFARRTDIKESNDRYANSDTNHLLNLIDAHRGAIILASNRRGDLDSAFIRRLRHVLDFQRPAAPERRALWEKAVRAIAPHEWPALAEAVGELAQTVDVSGAQINNAALTALFVARRGDGTVKFPHLLQGIDRELSKDGRPAASKLRERWNGNA